MDEEFFFPQNVQTSYRLWIFGPRHLRRLLLALVLGVAMGGLLYRHSLILAALAGVLAAAAVIFTCCAPFTGEETLVDIVLAFRRYYRGQRHFPYRKEGQARAKLDTTNRI